MLLRTSICGRRCGLRAALAPEVEVEVGVELANSSNRLAILRTEIFADFDLESSVSRGVYNSVWISKPPKSAEGANSVAGVVII